MITSFWSSERADQFDFIAEMRLITGGYGYVIPEVVSRCKAVGLSHTEIRDLICGHRCPYNVSIRGPKYHFEQLSLNNEDKPTFYLMLAYANLKTTILRFGSRVPTTNPSIKIRWQGMCRRVLHEKDPAFKNYGGRGIKICDAWHPLNPDGFSNYANWLKDQIAECNVDKFQIDREDNDGDYDPANCRVVPSIVNAQNTRLTKLTFDKVVEIRTSLKDVPKDLRHKEITKLASDIGCTSTALMYAVNGRNWTNVDSVAKPIEVSGGKSGSELILTDEVVISARERMRQCPADKRTALLTTIAAELGLRERSIVSHITGVAYSHLDEKCPPCSVGRAITRYDVDKLKEEWLSLKGGVSLSQFCVTKAKALGIPFGTIYDRLTKVIPESLWKLRNLSRR